MQIAKSCNLKIAIVSIFSEKLVENDRNYRDFFKNRYLGMKKMKNDINKMVMGT